jgi:hypothetical protein
VSGQFNDLVVEVDPKGNVARTIGTLRSRTTRERNRALDPQGSLASVDLRGFSGPRKGCRGAWNFWLSIGGPSVSRSGCLAKVGHRACPSRIEAPVARLG